MTFLRKHWLVWASFGLLAFWIAMWLIFMPPATSFDILEITEPIHYWSVITPSLSQKLLGLAFTLSTVIAIVLAWFIWKRYLGYLLVIVFLSCISSTLLTAIHNMNLWMFNNSIEHIEAVNFGGKEYRLALVRLWDEDHEYANYNVFECDTDVETCDPIILPPQGCGYMDDYIRAASLIMNKEQTTLSLNCEGYEMEIASTN